MLFVIFEEPRRTSFYIHVLTGRTKYNFHLAEKYRKCVHKRHLQNVSLFRTSIKRKRLLVSKTCIEPFLYIILQGIVFVIVVSSENCLFCVEIEKLIKISKKGFFSGEQGRCIPFQGGDFFAFN